jgi:hypothetical protein
LFGRAGSNVRAVAEGMWAMLAGAVVMVFVAPGAPAQRKGVQDVDVRLLFPSLESGFGANVDGLAPPQENAVTTTSLLGQ